jgi:tetratricopeptide (TPR) repeat protein/transglutaminase-like putative cysteine protease
MVTRVPVLCCFVLLASSIWAQLPGNPAKPDLSEEAFVFEHLNESVRFENDGSGVHETSAVIRINSQAGVQAFGQLVFGYSTANEDLLIKYVRVRKADGSLVETPVSAAQDFAPEVLREAPMYSDYRQRHVSVVDLKPGVTLEYDTLTHMKSLAPGEFWYEYNFPAGWALADATLQISVPKSREVKLKSPDRKYEMRDEEDRRTYSWSIHDFVPKRGKPGSEEEDEAPEGPDVQLSSFRDWQQVSQWYAKLQGERAIPDDIIKKKAAELTHGANSAEEKARTLYSFVALSIRYVSLSFGIGRYQPHVPSEVLQNGYGDCKDKHTLLQALLAAEGIQSYPVLIHSARKLDNDVPSPAQFDHVITAAKLGAKLIWLDTTAEVAPYGLIAYQLRNKEALIVASDALGVVSRTPAVPPIQNRTELSIKANISELGALDADVEVSATGDSDWPLRATFRQVPQANWARLLQSWSHLWGLPGDVTEVHIPAIEDTSKALRLSYHVQKSDFLRVPSGSMNFQLLPAISAGRIGKASKKHPSDPLDVGPATETVYRSHVEFPSNFSVHVPGNVNIVREYGEYASTYKLSKNIMDAERRMLLKVNELPATRRADYISFHNVTTGAVEETPWCSAARPSATALASAAEMKGSPAELREAAAAALRRQDFNTAASLLQRAADQDPTAKDGWEGLGQAYSGLNQHEKAVHAFQTAIDRDPDHPHVNAELAAELCQLGRYDEGIRSYRRQIELAPTEKSAHKQLGLLLVRLKRDSEAQTELEAAAAIPPEDPELKMALAQLYARTGNSNKAELIMSGSSAGTGTASDLFAAALRDDADADQLLHDSEKSLSILGDQFESGEYDKMDVNAFGVMDSVALAWAREGWGRFLHGDTLAAWQFLEAAWDLSQSGTVGNRLARVFEKTGARDRAQHMYALAVVAGGPDAQSSKDKVMKLNPANATKTLAEARAELDKMRTLPLRRVVPQDAVARFALLFDNSNTPDRVQFIDGDESLHVAADELQKIGFPVKFPDVSSVKIVRMGKVSCVASGCSFSFQPLNSMEQSAKSELEESPK